MSLAPAAYLFGTTVARWRLPRWRTVVACVVLTGAALVYTAQHFALTADTSELISTKLKWRQNELAFDRAFPQFNNLTMIVVDGATPELADAADVGAE